MDNEILYHSKENDRKLWLVVGFILLSIILWLSAQASRQLAIENLKIESEHRLSLYVSNLQGQLEKYEFLPELLATNRLLIQFLQQPGDIKSINALNRYLETINQVADASDTYLMNPDGWTIAASNWQSEKPFVGKNFSYRPYFQEAMKGKLGRYFALGSTSNKRGYFFAYPVTDKGEILGAVVMKIELSPFEERWSAFKEEFIVTDPDGVIFISTNEDWRYKSLDPLNDAVLERIRVSRRYGNSRIQPLGISIVEQLDNKTVVVNTGDRRSADVLMLKHDMPEAGWQVHLFSEMDVVNSQVLKTLVFVSILYSALVLLVLFLVQRRKRINERIRFEKEAKEVLETKVKVRTADLTQSNVRLVKEIEERRRTEEALRLAQDELIQAAKMAALGQLSSGINHELNQPLAAIRSYADNAQALLQRQRYSEASWNLEQISELTERMAKISAQLKIFSRKTTGRMVSISVQAVVDNVLKIVGANLKDSGTQLNCNFPDHEVMVLGDMVQLEQVMVNLLTNAVHAVENQAEKRIELNVEEINEKCRMTIIDNGPGIEEQNLKRIFDPFFTTKSEDRGLGLGLSISYRIIEMMQGTLSAKNHPRGGALFEIMLDLAMERDQEKLVALQL